MKSFVTPFQVVGGRIAVTTDPIRMLDQKITDVLVTNSFERPTMPDYGAGSQRLVFEQLDELVIADYKIDAGLEVSRRVSGVDLVDLHVLQDDAEGTAVIDVIYKSALSTVRSVTIQVAAGLLTEETPI